MTNFIIQHQVASALFAAYIFSSFIGALPTPKDKSPAYYVFLYNFMHLLAANALRIPAIRTFIATQFATPGEPKKDA